MNKRSFLKSLLVGLTALPFVKSAMALNKRLGEINTVTYTPLGNKFKEVDITHLVKDIVDKRFAMVVKSYNPTIKDVKERFNSPLEIPKFELVYTPFKDLKKGDVFRLFNSPTDQVGKYWKAYSNVYQHTGSERAGIPIGANTIKCFEYDTIEKAMNA